METFNHIFSVILHLDLYLGSFAQHYGPWLYGLLFLIIFCETGLVIFPFLPGDSLLFAAGSIVALSNSLNIHLLALLLMLAALLGNLLNYSIGHFLGARLCQREHVWLLNKQHLERTHRFYEQHGGKAIIIGRFLPIIRTCVPFVAGIGTMEWKKFMLYSAMGSFLWVGFFLYLSYYFGNIPMVKNHFGVIVILIIVVSLIPAVVGFIQNRRSTKSNPLEQPHDKL